MSDVEPTDLLARYARQMRFSPLGEAGQRRLLAARVLICGCGALGTTLANTLVRAGVGFVRLVDRDFPELSNLQRQVLFDERDVELERPKAIAAAERLRTINASVTVEPIVADVNASNIAGLCEGVDLILDGTDNFETRFLLNDASLRWNIPWVFAGCLGSEGQTMTIVPGQTPCLRCLMPEPPQPGTMPTCETSGILAPAVQFVSAIQAAEALKLLSGNVQAIQRSLVVFDLWNWRVRAMSLEQLQPGGCPACGQRVFDWLDGRRGNPAAVLCGRNAVQLPALAGAPRLSLESLATKLAGVGSVRLDPFRLRLSVEKHELTIFPDGRVIVGGTQDATVARSLVARWLGS